MESTEKKVIYPSVDRPWMKHHTERAQGLELPKGTMFDLIYANNKDYPNDIALEYMDVKITYGELWQHIEDVSKSLAALGVKVGEIVTIAMPNTPEFVYLAYALNRIGAVMNIIHPLPSEEELHGYLKEADSRFFFMFDGTYDLIKDSLDKTPVQKAIVASPAQSLNKLKRTLYKIAKFPKLNPENTISWEEFIKNGAGANSRYVDKDPNTMAVISHTGGTTGEPKGVMLTDVAMNSVGYQVWKTFPMGELRQRVMMIVLPPFVNYSFCNGIHEGLIMGDKIALLPEYKPEDFADYYKQFKPNYINSIPQYCLAMLTDEKLKDMDLSELKYVAAGGEAMDATAEKELNDFLVAHGADMKISKGYGCTEFTSVVSYTYPEVNFLHSVGVPFPYVNVQIVDTETGEELPCGERGEICVTGPSLMLGYYKNQEATDDIIKVHKDGQRWLHMGDLGFVDEDGVLFITGRIKRIIMTKGSDGNVTKMFPDRIENAINKCDEVNASCVIGVKDEERIHYPKAYIELKDNAIDKEVARENILAICRRKLPDYQVPTEIEFMPELPRTERGKVDFKALDVDADL